jgi:hypothetical protein
VIFLHGDLYKEATMKKLVAALGFMLLASPVFAKTCIVIDTGGFPGSQFVLLKASLGPGSAGPAEGYLAQFNSFSNAFDQFIPVSGQSVVNHQGLVALGLVVANVNVNSGGGGTSTLPNTDVQLLCEPSSGKTKVGIGDGCGGSYGEFGLTAHLVACTSSVAIP